MHRRGHLPPAPREPVFDANAVLHAHIRSGQCRTCRRAAARLLRQAVPIFRSPARSTRRSADGPLHALTASGSAQMERGTLYGEPVSGLRVQAALAGQVLKLTSATFNVAGGNISASGSYDFNARALPIEHSRRKHRHRPRRLRPQPRSRRHWQARVFHHRLRHVERSSQPLEGHATLTALTFGGQHFGTLEATAHSTGPLSGIQRHHATRASQTLPCTGKPLSVATIRPTPSSNSPASISALCCAWRT